MAVLEAHEAHQNLVDELLEEVAAYNPEVDRDLLTRAFLFAARAHEGQQRRSGEAFIHHPWGVAKICAQLHNLRQMQYLGKQKQLQKARETLEGYAPLAHRLGIHALKWELEDLAFATLHPRKYEEIKTMVAERRADR